MTESEYLQCADPKRLLTYLTDRPRDGTIRGGVAGPPLISDRKLRLWFEALASVSEYDYGYEEVPSQSTATWALRIALLWSDASHDRAGDPPLTLRAALLRDIVGNPFRPVHQCRMCLGGGYVPTDRDDSTCEVCKGTGRCMPREVLRWNGGAIPALAQEMYDSHDFADMGILADMLTDSGCRDVDIIHHCQGLSRCLKCLGTGVIREHRPYPGGWDVEPCGCGSGWVKVDTPHVRGCWVIDLLTNQE